MRKTSLKCIYNLSEENDKIVFIGSDLGPAILEEMEKKYPDRWFMEGISEQHIIGMAAGLALEGFIPYVNTIASFLTRRCYEQIAIDVCLENLPVRLLGIGGGYVYAPLGPTHMAVEDISIMRCLPNMTVISPCDADEMKRVMDKTAEWPHPIYIRFGKGGDQIISSDNKGFEIGKSILMKEPGDGLFVSTGVMTQLALSASKELEDQGIKTGVLHMHTIKPLDGKTLKYLIPKVKKVITCEEHTRIGGFGTSILEYCNDHLVNDCKKIHRIGLPDKFADKYGNQNLLLNHMGLSKDYFVKKMKEILTK